MTALTLSVGQSITLIARGPADCASASWTLISFAAQLARNPDGSATITGIRPGQTVVTVTHGLQVVALNLIIVDVPLRLEIVPAATPNSFAWFGLPQSLGVYADRGLSDDIVKPPSFRGMNASSV